MATTYYSEAQRTRAGRRPKQPKRKRMAPGARLWQASPLTYIMLVAAGILSIFPLYFMIVGATLSNDELNKYPPHLLPGGQLFTNLQRVWENDNANIATGLLNSVIVSSCVTVSVVFFSSLAGFAFAKLQFRGKSGFLLAILGSMMVPVQLGIIPLYLMMVKLGWENHIQAVIVPFLVSGFGVFMMRQYASQAIPTELIEAARVDGSTTWGIYWHVVLPALRPGAAVLAIFTFVQTWNEFLWSLMALQDPANPTVQLSLRRLGSAYYTDYSQVFAGTVVATIPLLIVFLVFGRQIIGGIMEGAVKA